MAEVRTGRQSAQGPHGPSSNAWPQLTDDGANELTPRAPDHTITLPTVTELDGTIFEAMDFDYPDRPETPTPPPRMSCDSGALLIGVDADQPDMDKELQFVHRQTPASVAATLDDAFQGIYLELSNLASCVGLLFSKYSTVSPSSSRAAVQ